MTTTLRSSHASVLAWGRELDLGAGSPLPRVGEGTAIWRSQMAGGEGFGGKARTGWAFRYCSPAGCTTSVTAATLAPSGSRTGVAETSRIRVVPAAPGARMMPCQGLPAATAFHSR